MSIMDRFDNYIEKYCILVTRYFQILMRENPKLSEKVMVLAYSLTPLLKKSFLELSYINASITLFALFAIYNSFINLVNSVFFIQVFGVQSLLAFALFLDKGDCTDVFL